jgi:hypothetical protein
MDQMFVQPEIQERPSCLLQVAQYQGGLEHVVMIDVLTICNVYSAVTYNLLTALRSVYTGVLIILHLA